MRLPIAKWMSLLDNGTTGSTCGRVNFRLYIELVNTISMKKGHYEIMVRNLVNQRIEYKGF